MDKNDGGSSKIGEAKLHPAPLFWAAVALCLGLWVGLRVWRPPLWWLIGIVAFVFAASYFLAKRPWLSKALSLGAWALLGIFLIQARAQADNLTPGSASILAYADGNPVILTAHVIKEGYTQEAYPGSVRKSIDVETESIDSHGEIRPVKAGIRLTIYEKI